MIETHLGGVDLNLLLVLDVLLEERSVTRAAARLDRTQPAVSRSLARLRELLDDPLFVRDRSGLTPTPRAQALAGPLRAALLELEGRVLQARPFDPGSADRTFTLAGADYGEWLLVGPLVTRLARVAPRIRVEAHRVPALRDTLDHDIGVGVVSSSGLGSVRTRPLVTDGFVCLVRRDHPRVGQHLDLRTYLDLDHILISPRGTGGGIVDDRLEAAGERRRIAVRLATFLVAPAVVAGTDLLCTLPRRLAHAAVRSLPVRMVEPPIELPPFTLSAVWHERWQHDPGHAWLREQLAAVVQDDQPALVP